MVEGMFFQTKPGTLVQQQQADLPQDYVTRQVRTTTVPVQLFSLPKNNSDFAQFSSVKLFVSLNIFQSLQYRSSQAYTKLGFEHMQIIINLAFEICTIFVFAA